MFIQFNIIRHELFPRINKVPKGQIDYKKALARVIACCRTGDKPFTEPILIQFTDAYMRNYREMSQRTAW